MLIRLASVYRSVNIGQKRGAKSFTMHKETLSMACITTHGHSHTGCWWKFNLCQNTRHIPWSREPLLTMDTDHGPAGYLGSWGQYYADTEGETTTTLGLMPSFRGRAWLMRGICKPGTTRWYWSSRPSGRDYTRGDPEPGLESQIINTLRCYRKRIIVVWS